MGDTDVWRSVNMGDGDMWRSVNMDDRGVEIHQYG